jgi:copper chaperone NosL
MSKITKILIIIASLAMISVFFFPLWQIDLEAPQYPEGLGLRIWVNKITGDLQTINGLNHYIGMKTIEPDSIKELTIMPYVIGVLIIFGIITGVTGKRKLLWVWVVLLLGAGIVGGYDFYTWEYDYGHNLNPDAAIKVPGMSYQPPLIGSKQLLNFVAHSYPDIGGYAVIVAGLLAVVLLVCEYACKKSSIKNINLDNEKISENKEPVNGNVISDNRVIMQH